jgi:serine/threonine-protein phosphatase 5
VESILKAEDNIVKTIIPKNGTITICGDLHGQYNELLTILKLNGNPSVKSAYLFTGDYVDRGVYAVEILVTLMAWKCLYPDNVFMIRGNHENKQVHKVHGYTSCDRLIDLRMKY